MYFNGWGVPKDYVRAHMWANLAAASNNEEAGCATISLPK
jgi:TPR repeat protein